MTPSRVYGILISLIYLMSPSTSDSASYFEATGDCEFQEDNLKFGGNNHGLLGSLIGGHQSPAVFVCNIEDAGKYLSVNVVKQEGLTLHGKDPIELYVGAGFKQCGKDMKLQPEQFTSSQVLSVISEDSQSYMAQNVRLADAICWVFTQSPIIIIPSPNTNVSECGIQPIQRSPKCVSSHIVIERVSTVKQHSRFHSMINMEDQHLSRQWRSGWDGEIY